MSFNEIYQNNHYLFYDGPMETRIEYGTDLQLDKEMSIFLLLETNEGREALSALYRQDIETVMPFGAPIILNAPTFRASKEHCQRLGISDAPENVYQINKDSITLLRSIRDEYTKYKNKILVTAPIGPKYAGFTPDKSTSIASEVRYHKVQIHAVADIGVDLISIAAMPGGIECIGAAIAASQTTVDYTVGFVVTDQGTLLDGMTIEQLIHEIDIQTAAHKPVGYIIGCTHPSVASVALKSSCEAFERIIGIKANGSAKPPTKFATKPPNLSGTAFSFFVF